MTQQEKLTIPQEAFDWYDEYAHGFIDRRTFMSRLATLTGAGLSMGFLTASLMPNYALAEQVSFNDPDIRASFATFDSPQGYQEGRGYLVQPAKLSATASTVLVVHENRGLNPYIKDVARRLAKAGYIAFAPDALHSLGGYPGNDEEGKAMQKSLDREKIEQDFIAAARFLKSHASGNGKLGVVGFCFGGYVSNMLAATLPDIVNAAVPFYGTPAKDEIVRNIKGPLMLHFAGLDKRVNQTWPAYEGILKQLKVNYQAFIYAEVNHGFHNDSTGRYDEASAQLAWTRTLDFFAKNLG